MLISMTGYGQANSDFEGGRLNVEVQCLNRRYLEFNVNLPREWNCFEVDVRKIAQSMINRGKINISVIWEKPQFPQTTIEVDFELARQYYQALQDLADELDLEEDLSIKDLLSNKEILKLTPMEVDLQIIQEALEKTVQNAIERAQEMRRVEGDFIAKDITKRLALFESYILEIESLAPLQQERQKEKIKQKMESVLDLSVEDDTRALREVSIAIEKLDVTEEIVRFKSHIQQFKNSLSSGEPVGKMMDFLLQEMNRETNTIASKSSDAEIVKFAIEIKNEIERVREQVQNVE